LVFTSLGRALYVPSQEPSSPAIMNDHADVLLVTVTKVESLAVLADFERSTLNAASCQKGKNCYS
jgi:hypothetical protein